MDSVSQLLATAFRHHQAGRRDDAEKIYRHVLELDQQNVDAWHLLGVVAYERGQYARAREYLDRTIGLKPDYAEAHYHLGNVRYEQGDASEAVACYGRAIALKPGYVEAHNNLGNAFKRLERLSDAEACYRRVLEIRPEHVNALFNLGNTLRERAAWQDAERCYRRAVQLQVDFAEAHYCLGLAHFEQDKFAEAVARFERAVELKPKYADAWNDLGQTLKDLGKYDEAIESFRRALAECPDEFTIHNNLAVALWDVRRLDEATASFQRALELKPESAELRWNLSLLKLLRGDFEAGWKEYEWRWKTGQLSTRECANPLWNGEPLDGRTILLHAEQGFGDTLQFIRYAAVLKRMGGRVIVECQKPLVKVLASCVGVDELVGQGDAVGEFDVHCPLLSVPRVLKTDLGSIPAEGPYLFADALAVAEWRARLEGVQGFRIGINWRGRKGKGPFRRRNIPLACFATLAEIPGVRLISLQRGAAEDLSALGGGLPIVDFGEQLDGMRGAFVDTAAIMANIDLVITSDTSIPHLAGALGVPVWVALPFMPDWRWLLDRSDSPWYPTMRLFRQKSPGDWAEVFQDIRAALGERMEPGKGRG